MLELKCFLNKLIIFSITLVFLLSCLDFVVTSGLKKSNYRDLPKWVEITNGGIDAQVIIVGSSRALVHFDCEKISKKTGLSCYNLGLDGSNFKLQKEILELYLRKNKTPERLIWSLDINTLGEIDTFYGIENLVPFMREPEIREIISIQNSNPEYLYYLPMIRYKFNSNFIPIGLLSYLNLIKYRRRVIHGYREMDLEWRQNYHSNEAIGFEPKFNYIYKSNFFEFIKYLKSRSINISFLISPYFKSDFNSDISILNFENEFNSIASGIQIPVYSYLNSKLFSNKKYFYDYSHLNKDGVEILMDEFLKDYK